jgi:hypothetical protein
MLQEGQTIGHKTAELVEHLPDVVEHAATRLPGQAETVVPEMATKFSAVGSSITTFGQSLLAGTQELIDQVRCRRLTAGTGILRCQLSLPHVIRSLQHELA